MLPVTAAVIRTGELGICEMVLVDMPVVRMLMLE